MTNNRKHEVHKLVQAVYRVSLGIADLRRDLDLMGVLPQAELDAFLADDSYRKACELAREIWISATEA